MRPTLLPTLRAFALGLTLTAGALCTSWSPSVAAQQAPGSAVIRGVEVLGVIRVDRTSVRSKIYSQVGQVLEPARVSEDIKRIYRMGFFDDVQAATKQAPDGGVMLVFQVTERPTILEVVYDIRGDELDSEELGEVVNLKRYDILDEEAVKQNLSKIRERYEEDGFYLVDTSYELKKAGPHSVVVTLKIDEGEPVEVRQVNGAGDRRQRGREGSLHSGHRGSRVRPRARVSARA